MAHIVNPYNLDDDDDAVFSALLSQGLIWVEDDDDNDDYYHIDFILEEARDFIYEQSVEWVDFSRLCQHLHKTFDKLKPKRLGQPEKEYKSLLKFFADYPSDFDLRQDDEKKGRYFIRLKRIG